MASAKRLKSDGEHGTPQGRRRRRRQGQSSETAEKETKAILGEEAEKKAPAISKSGSTRGVSVNENSTPTSPAAHKHNSHSRNNPCYDVDGDDLGRGDVIRRKGNRIRPRNTGGMSASTTSSSSLSVFPASLILHKRYILPTLLLVAALAVGTVTASATEEGEILREPRHRRQYPPLDLAGRRPVQAHPHRRRQHAPSRDLNVVARDRDLYSNSTAIDGTHRRRDANLTLGR